MPFYNDMAEIAEAVESGELNAHACMIPIAELTTTQENIEESVIVGMVDAKALPPIFVVRAVSDDFISFDYFVEDGHHRLERARRAGRDEVLVVVCEKVGRKWRVVEVR